MAPKSKPRRKGAKATGVRYSPAPPYTLKNGPVFKHEDRLKFLYGPDFQWFHDIALRDNSVPHGPAYLNASNMANASNKNANDTDKSNSAIDTALGDNARSNDHSVTNDSSSVLEVGQITTKKSDDSESED